MMGLLSRQNQNDFLNSHVASPWEGGRPGKRQV